jgi:hypothetical protein
MLSCGTHSVLLEAENFDHWLANCCRALFIIIYAALCGLINREPGGCSKVESAAPVDIERWYPIGDCDG